MDPIMISCTIEVNKLENSKEKRGEKKKWAEFIVKANYNSNDEQKKEGKALIRTALSPLFITVHHPCHISQPIFYYLPCLVLLSLCS